MMEALREAGELVGGNSDTRDNRYEIEARVEALMAGGVVNGAIVDSSLHTWPALAKQVADFGAPPTYAGWQTLVDKAAKMLHVKHMQHIYAKTTESNVAYVPWDWAECCEALIKQHGTSDLWKEVFLAKMPLSAGHQRKRLIGWLGEADRTLLDCYHQTQRDAGIDPYSITKLPVSVAGRTKLLCQVIDGKRGDVMDEIAGEERVRWACQLLDVGAEPNMAQGNGQSAMARAIKAGDKMMVELLLGKGASIEWADIEPAISKRVERLHTAVAYGLGGDIFSGDQDREWLSGILSHLPLDFEWDRKVLVGQFMMIDKMTREEDLLPHIKDHLPFIVAMQQSRILGQSEAPSGMAPSRQRRL